jgi:hypothetical protein
MYVCLLQAVIEPRWTTHEMLLAVQGNKLFHTIRFHVKVFQ